MSEYYLGLRDRLYPQEFSNFVSSNLPLDLPLNHSVFISRSPRKYSINEVKNRYSTIAEHTKESLTELAVETGCLIGKWMLLYCLKENINETWLDLIENLITGNLGIAIKIFKRSADYYGIYFYNTDFRDLAEVDQLSEDMYAVAGNLMKSDAFVYYKPEIYTLCGIKSGNPYGIKASIYQVKVPVQKSRTEEKAGK